MSANSSLFAQLLQLLPSPTFRRIVREEKLEAIKREAFTVALDWLVPMRNAEIRASSLVMTAIQGTIDDE